MVAHSNDSNSSNQEQPASSQNSNERVFIADSPVRRPRRPRRVALMGPFEALDLGGMNQPETQAALALVTVVEGSEIIHPDPLQLTEPEERQLLGIYEQEHGSNGN
eukprot:TRINITY_DN868_c0_g1_i2.p2 TRINITY_DN868_c0_g1~~TRINITY_DN868_c0_g1_i2.p2  ORF type:complete len:106 (-),score=18.12 TRINITY_DN868_c0_g1_i2:1905-2222(-)